MDNLFTKKVPLYFETDESQLVVGDSFKILTKMEPESVDMIFADPPYFLSNDGITCKGGKMVSVNKGSWDKLSERPTPGGSRCLSEYRNRYGPMARTHEPKARVSSAGVLFC